MPSVQDFEKRKQQLEKDAKTQRAIAKAWRKGSFLLLSAKHLLTPLCTALVVNKRLPELTEREKAVERREEALRKASASASAKEMQLALQSAEIDEKLADAQRVENLAVEAEVRNTEMQQRWEELQRRETAVADMTQANAEWEMKLLRQEEELNTKESETRCNEDACIEMMKDCNIVSEEMKYLRKHKEVLDREIGAFRLR